MSKSSEAAERQSEAIDLREYVDMRRRIDGVLDCVTHYRSGLESGRNVEYYRRILASLIGQFAAQDDIKALLKISDQQAQMIADGGEIPEHILNEIEARHRKFRKNLASYLPIR